jgi:uncharacterized protein (TIGR02246 family)
MKRALTVLAIACMGLGVAGWQAGGGAPGDDEAVRARIDGFATAWNNHSASEMASFWSEDGDLINPSGRVAKGRAMVQALFTDEQAAGMKDSHFQVRVSGVRVIADGAVAVTDWDITLTNKAPDGATTATREFHAASVLQKVKGTWMFESVRPYVFMPKDDKPPMPPPPPGEPRR